MNAPRILLLIASLATVVFGSYRPTDYESGCYRPQDILLLREKYAEAGSPGVIATRKVHQGYPADTKVTFIRATEQRLNGESRAYLSEGAVGHNHLDLVLTSGLAGAGYSYDVEIWGSNATTLYR